MTEKELEELTGEFCDKYCKFPFVCTDEETLESACNVCPMNKLFDLLSPRHLLNVGDDVWIVGELEGKVWIEANKITEVCTKGFYISACMPPEDDVSFFISFDEINSTAFFKREKAEKAKKEREG